MEQQQDLRKRRGESIANQFKIEKHNNHWLVPSTSQNKVYKVTLHPLSCTCADYTYRKLKCKHIHAAQNRSWYNVNEITDPQHSERPIKFAPMRRTYPQAWSAYNAAQQTEKLQFQKLLSALCNGIGEPSQDNGRPRLPLEDMIFACVFKVYSTFSGRRFTTDLNDAQEKGFISKTPHFNSVLRYFDKEEMTAYLEMLIEESSLPLVALEENFAVDASGLSQTHGFTWNYAKHENPKVMVKKDWVKIHICTGTKTNVVTAVRVTDRFQGDHKFFEPLVAQTRQNFKMRAVSADKAYLSKHNLDAAVMNEAMPFIAFKENSKSAKKDSVWNRLYHFYNLNQKEFMKEYGRRANVKTTFSMIKAKFSGTLRAKNKTSQTNEALCKILAHNICVLIQSMNEFGITAEFWQDNDLH